MAKDTIIDELYRYNAWANHKVLGSCDSLSDSQLDERREMGFGSLRQTLFHILEAERLWLERWMGMDLRPITIDAGGMPLDRMADELARVDRQRETLIDNERTGCWARTCAYRNSQGESHSNSLIDLLIHVANHGIHHRAQAMNFLKRHGRTVPGGIDYLFFRLARPVIRQDEATATSMRQYGMEVDSAAGSPVVFDAEIVKRYFAYGDWANRKLLELTVSLDDVSLDHSFGIGMDTIRKNLLHIQDAERWWIRNWTEGPTPFERAAETTSVAELTKGWQDVIRRRNRFVAGSTIASTIQAVTVMAGPMSIKVLVIESLLQLCGHGTHHRAQLLNMLRHSGVVPPSLDYVVWLRESQLDGTAFIGV